VSSLVQTDAARTALAPVLARLKDVQLPERDPLQRLAVEYSFPDWLVRRFQEQFGPEEAQRLCESLNTPAPLNLRVNALKATVEDCQKKLAHEGIETTRTKHSPVGLTAKHRANIFRLPSFRDGLFEVQDEGSQLLAVLIDPKPTWKVLDACAGAGGKTLHLAAIMKNRGEIVASDINGFRLNELRKRARRAGASNIRVMTTEEMAAQERFRQWFDVVFLDAPCSGIGTLRRNPGMKWTLKEEHIAELTTKQLHIMESHAPMVKPGGLYYYATCSLLEVENRGIISEFLHRHPEFVFEDLGSSAAKTGFPSLLKDGCLSLLPHLHGTDGFFCAALRRSAGAADA
jgi:16S rRNA (cytosine967-C5)-methyltransferase